MSSPLEGQGVINFSTEKPSYGFTTQTTEFHDELMKRGIVDFEQCMIAKGATPEEARRLRLRHEETDAVNEVNKYESAEDSSESDDIDDDFLKQYQSKRRSEMQLQFQRKQESTYGEVIQITTSNPDEIKEEWKINVNESSKVGKKCVIVHLSYPRGEAMDVFVSMLARKYPCIKFVSIEYKTAVPNWPREKLPALFIYQNGDLREKIVGARCESETDLKSLLCEYGVLEAATCMENVEEKSEEHQVKRGYGYKGLSSFGGMVSTLATEGRCHDSDEDMNE